MPRSKRKRDDEERRKHRELMEIRRAALKVAEWEHGDDPDVKDARESVAVAKDRLSTAQTELRAKRGALQIAEENLLKVLQKHLPEDLRPPED